MSEDAQAREMNRLAREHGGSGMGGPPLEVASEAAPKPELPWVELPREGRQLSAFARELGDVCSKNGVYRRDKIPVTINRETGLIDVIRAEEFVGYIEGLCFPFINKIKKTEDDDTGEISQTRVKTLKSINKNTAALTLSHPDFVYRQRRLERVNPVRMPIKRADGRIELLREGYDVESGILTLASGVEVREDVTVAEAAQGIFHLFHEFPFADWDAKRSERRMGQSRSLSVQVAQMLAFYGALILPLNALRLGGLFNANSHGAGKSLLLKMIVTPVMGKTRLRGMPKNDEEFRKMLETAALGAAPYIALDNVSGNLRNDDLDVFITSEDFGGRLMHTQKEFEVARQSIVLVTGHNLTLSGDLARRLLECKLSVDEADIRDRSVTRPIDDNWLKRPMVRSDVLSMLWAIIRGWDEAGRQRGKTSMGGFEEWCAVFGGMTEFAGFGDPCEKPPADESADSELEDMVALVTKLAAEIDGGNGEKLAEFTFSEVLETCVQESCFTWMIEGKWREPKEGPKFYEPTARTESSMGKMLSMKYGGRLFTLKDGRRVRFGKKGKNRHKRYQVQLELPS